MRRSHHRRRDSEMLVVHKPAQPVADTDAGADGAEGRAGGDDLARLRGQVAAARDRNEKEAAIAEIQERFGNDAAADAVRGARRAEDDGAGDEG